MFHFLFLLEWTIRVATSWSEAPWASVTVKRNTYLPGTRFVNYQRIRYVDIIQFKARQKCWQKATIKALVRSLLAMMAPAARLSGSLVQSHDWIPTSSVDDEPLRTIHFSGSETVWSPPALALGFSFSSLRIRIIIAMQQLEKWWLLYLLWRTETVTLSEPLTPLSSQAVNWNTYSPLVKPVTLTRGWSFPNKTAAFGPLNIEIKIKI